MVEEMKQTTDKERISKVANLGLLLKVKFLVLPGDLLSVSLVGGILKSAFNMVIQMLSEVRDHYSP